MYKIAIDVPNTKNWIGGLNYFVNLANAWKILSDPGFELVIVGDKSLLPPPLNSLSEIPLKKKSTFHRIIGRLKKILFGIDPKTKVLKSQDIDLYSHGFLGGSETEIRSLPWIPDFQHKYFPHLFTKNELLRRERLFKTVATKSSHVLLSSHTAHKDFIKFYPLHQCQTHVLQFVSATAPNLPEHQVKYILNKLKVDEPYFYIPNQLWVHKNHMVVIEAMNALLKDGKCPLIISTGNTEDYRNRDHFKNLLALVEKYNLQTRLKFLGIVEYEVVASLMQGAVALINPSHFEGWSTTVEEAKSTGKKILLSDIEVHREQAPERGKYFSPNDHSALALLINETMESYSFDEEKRFQAEAQEKLPSRMLTFASRYRDIVLKVME